jgi:thiol:disulfide interchange protein
MRIGGLTLGMTNTCRKLWLFGLILLVTAPFAFAATSADVSAALDKAALHAGDSGTVAVIVQVKPGLHAQSHTPLNTGGVSYIPLVVTPKADASVTFGTPIYPPGEIKNYPALGTVNVYAGKIVVQVPFTVESNTPVGKLAIAGKVHLQACNDSSCFRPEDIPFSIDADIVAAGTVVTASHSDLFKAPAAAPTEAPADIKAIFAMFGLAFVIGIIFNAMPCVLPVVPLKIMGFYEVSQHNRAKAIALGGVFSLGLIASFGVLAVLVVGLRVLNWGGLFQELWFTIAIVAVLTVMAFSLLGVFTVNLPSAVYQFSPRHDTYVGNFLFGILTAALSTPCTFGMFVFLLTWSLAEPTPIGVGAIMMVGVGMAFPYFVLSAFPEVARKFPRTGPWAEVVKQMMAFLLLGTAVYFAQPLYERFVSDSAFWWTMFAVVVAAAVFLMFRTIQLSKTTRPRVIAGVVALTMLIPSFWAVRRLTYQPYDWQPYTEKTLATAQASGKPVLIDFTATWCGNCHFIEGFVLNNPKVVQVLHAHGVQMVKADVTDDNAPAKPLLMKFRAAGEIPLTAVYAPGSNQPQLLDGIYTADELLRTIANITADTGNAKTSEAALIH